MLPADLLTSSGHKVYVRQFDKRKSSSCILCYGLILARFFLVHRIHVLTMIQYNDNIPINTIKIT